MCTSAETAQLVHDDVAVVVLRAYQPLVLDVYVPYAVAGDGNCCYRAVSLALYGTEEHHLHIRTLAAIEMLSHRHHYDVSDARYVGTIDVVDLRVLKSWRDVASLFFSARHTKEK